MASISSQDSLVSELAIEGSQRKHRPTHSDREELIPVANSLFLNFNGLDCTYLLLFPVPGPMSLERLANAGGGLSELTRIVMRTWPKFPNLHTAPFYVLIYFLCAADMYFSPSSPPDQVLCINTQTIKASVLNIKFTTPRDGF